MDTSEKLFGDAKIFAQHIVIALNCLGECRAMNQIFTSQRHKDQYHVARHFYRTAYFAMQYRFQMEVAKLFDPHKNSTNFDSFKNRVYKAGLLNKTAETKYSELRKNVKNDINTIIDRRNKIYAHSDQAIFNEPDQYLDAHPFNYDSVEKLLYEVLIICNNVILHLTEDRPARLFSANGNDDFVKLFGYESQAEKDFKQICMRIGGIS